MVNGHNGHTRPFIELNHAPLALRREERVNALKALAQAIAERRIKELQEELQELSDRPEVDPVNPDPDPIRTARVGKLIAALVRATRYRAFTAARLHDLASRPGYGYLQDALEFTDSPKRIGKLLAYVAREWAAGPCRLIRLGQRRGVWFWQLSWPDHPPLPPPVS